ncbi:MAG: hypothetical protein EOP45_08265, partial [Sphingobacteriaceae bacterium]
MEGQRKRKGAPESSQPESKKPKKNKNKRKEKDKKSKDGQNKKRKEDKSNGKSNSTKDNGDLYDNRMELINQKLELLDDKAKLLMDSYGIDKKTKNGVEFVKEKEINKTKYMYPVEFNYEIKSKEAFSPTALVRLEERGLKHGPVRSFFDTGAHPNIISYELFKKLKFPVTSSINRILGIDGVPFAIKYKVTMFIHPWYDSDSSLEMKETFWIWPKECKWAPVMPNSPIDMTGLTDDSLMPMADPEYGTPSRVHVLLGVGCFAR